MEFILLSEIKCPKYGGFLLIITGWGESGKTILQVSIAVLFGRCRKNFRAKMAQPPLEKNGPYIYITPMGREEREGDILVTHTSQ